MPEPGQKKTVQQVLQSLRSLDDLKQLFWMELNYKRENTPLSDRAWPDAARNALAEASLLLAGGGTDGNFHVIYNRLKSEDLTNGLERHVVNQLLKEHTYTLLVFSNEHQTRWHFATSNTTATSKSAGSSAGSPCFRPPSCTVLIKSSLPVAQTPMSISPLLKRKSMNQ